MTRHLKIGDQAADYVAVRQRRLHPEYLFAVVLVVVLIVGIVYLRTRQPTRVSVSRAASGPVAETLHLPRVVDGPFQPNRRKRRSRLSHHQHGRQATASRTPDAAERTPSQPTPALSVPPSKVSGDDQPAMPVEVHGTLTQGELRRASEGGLSMQRQCLAMLQGNYKTAEGMTDRAVRGLFELTHALRKDPDTAYVPPGEQAPTTMRELALTVLDTINSPDCGGVFAKNLARALAGLPR